MTYISEMSDEMIMDIVNDRVSLRWTGSYEEQRKMMNEIDRRAEEIKKKKMKQEELAIFFQDNLKITL